MAKSEDQDEIAPVDHKGQIYRPREYIPERPPDRLLDGFGQHRDKSHTQGASRDQC